MEIYTYKIVLPNGKEVLHKAEGFNTRPGDSNIHFFIENHMVAMVPNGSSIFEIDSQENITTETEINKQQDNSSFMDIEEIIKKRINDAFNNEWQKYERNELLNALETIKRLVPLDYFIKCE